MIRAAAGFGTRRPARALAVAAALLAFAANDAAADTGLCRQLEAELAGAGSDNVAQAKRYEDALLDQQREIDKARDQARQAGCGRAIFGDKVALCGSINASLQRMERNFVKLQQERARFGAGDGIAERSRLLAAIDANGCRAERPALPPAVEEQPAEEVVRDEPSDTRAGTLSAERPVLDVEVIGGDYGNAASDERRPQAETAIVSPTMEEPPRSVEEIGLPAESEGSADGGRAAVTGQPSDEAEARTVTAADRDVRRVGPRFLPDPEEAIDLRAPGPTPDP